MAFDIHEQRPAIVAPAMVYDVATLSWVRMTQPGAGAGGTSQLDESAFVEGTGVLTPVGGVLNDAITSDPSEDQAATVRITPKRAFHVNLRDAAGNELSVGGGTQYAEDTAHVTGDLMTMAGVVQQAADAALSTDLDRSLLQVDGSGFLKVNIKAGGGGGTQYDEDTVSTAADKITMAGVVRKDAAATLVDLDGDRTQLQVDASGRLHVNGSGVTQPVSGTVTANLAAGANNIGDVDVLSLPALPAGGNNIGDVDVLSMPAVVLGAGVAEIGKLAAGVANIGDVDVLTMPAVVLAAGVANIGDVDVLSMPAVVLGAGVAEIGKLAAGVANIGDVDVLTLPNVTLAAGTNTNEVVGDAADDAVVAGNPLSMGLTARQTNRTAVADGDAVRAAADDMGRQAVIMNQVRDLVVQSAAITLSSTTETSVIAAGAAGVFHDLTLLMVTNTSATAVRVDFRDATAGTVMFALAIAANGGAVVPFAVPWKQTTAATAWTAQLSAAVTDVRIAAQAVKNV